MAFPWPAVIEGAAMLGSSVLPSLFGGGGPSARDNLYEGIRAQLRWGPRLIEQDITSRVAAAKKAGIHPLVAMGMSPNSSGLMTPSGSTETGSMWGDALGEGIRGAVGAYRDWKADKREAGRLAMEAGANSLREQEARIFKDTASGMREMAEARKVIADARLRSIIARVQRQPGAVSTALTSPLGDWRTSATSRQQDVEDEYGDIVGEGYGIWRALNDITVQPRRPQVFNDPKSRAPTSADSFYPELY